MLTMEVEQRVVESVTKRVLAVEKVFEEIKLSSSNWEPATINQIQVSIFRHFDIFLCL